MPSNRNDNDWIRPFIGRLRSLLGDENQRGLRTLAELRRGLGKPEVCVLIKAGWLFSDVSDSNVDDACLLACLFALWHQGSRGRDSAAPRNLGASLASLRERTGSESIEKRFVGLLDSEREDVPQRLRHAISLLKSKDIAVNWWQLLHDIADWEKESRGVQKAWARAFWTT